MFPRNPKPFVSSHWLNLLNALAMSARERQSYSARMDMCYEVLNDPEASDYLKCACRAWIDINKPILLAVADVDLLSN